MSLLKLAQLKKWRNKGDKWGHTVLNATSLGDVSNQNTLQSFKIMLKADI